MDICKNNIKLIGITGFKRSGKDTIGEYLCDHKNYIRLGFADALKAACKNIFSFTDKQLYGNKEKEEVDNYWKHSPREILQKVGTELFREKLPELCKYIDDNIWIKSVERKILSLYNTNPNKNNKFVITDVRFLNECKFIKDMGGMMLRVNRFKFDKKDLQKLHVSERYIPVMVVDNEINNYNKLVDLYKTIDQTIN
jgi:hypothetical protein